MGAERLLRAAAARPDLIYRQRATLERARGQIHYQRGRLVAAGDAFACALQAALAAADRIEAGSSRRWAATVHYGLGRLDEARPLWEAARDDFVAAGDTLGEFDVLEDLAIVATGLDRRPYCERALAIARARRDPLLEARARRRWGQGLLDAAKPGPALVELERAVALLRGLGPGSHGHLADALAVLGWALRAHGSNDRAVPVHREAIRLARESGDLDGQVWNYFGLGIALVGLERYDEADVAMRRGRGAAARTGSLTTIRILAESDGWIALKKGDWARAAPALEAAIERPGTEVTAMPLVNLSEAYRHLGRIDEAIAAATRAVELARAMGLHDNELRAQIVLAHAHAARGDFDAAEHQLEGIAARLEADRRELAPIDFLKQGFADRFSDAYGLMVHVLMRQGRPAEALAAAERVRGRAFADLLLARRVKERDEADASQWLLEASSAAPEPARADSPAIAPPLDAPALARLAARLSTTIVSYWMHAAGSYAWVVTPAGEVHGATLAVDPARLARRIRTAVDVAPDVRLRGTGADAIAEAAPSPSYASLHRDLWAPIEGWLPGTAGARVTIVPHGPLFACPFAALRDPAGRYLIERYALSYAGSGAVLQEALERGARAGTSGARALIVADPRGAFPSARAALPAARREARAVERAVAMPTDVLLGNRAGEADVRDLLPRARLAHFATHAIVSDTDPLGSHLVLGGGGAGGAERDGRLTASEVASLSLNADLVVLGACRSGRGPVSSDGIAGLTRSFMAAGAPSVLATLWEVADEPTAGLMARFYQAYAARRPKDEALRAAQLAVIADLRAGRVKSKVGTSLVTYPEHPWLWAAPVLVGAP